MNLLAMFFAGLVGTAGFSIVFRLRLKRLPFAVLGGAVSCGTLMGMMLLTDDVFFQNLVAALAAALYAEIVARILRTPVTVFLLPALVCLAPGARLYSAMSYLVSGNQELFLSNAMDTILIAIAIAVGIVLVSVLLHLLPARKR